MILIIIKLTIAMLMITIMMAIITKKGKEIMKNNTNLDNLNINQTWIMAMMIALIII